MDTSHLKSFALGVRRVDALKASHHLRRLRDQGFLDQRGKGSATFYVPGERFLASLFPDNSPSLPGAPPSQPGKPPSLSGNPSPLSGNPPPLSGNLPPLSGNPPSLSGNLRNLSDSLPAHLRKEIASLKKRASLPVLNLLIREICRIRPFTADEIARLVGRSRKYVLDRVLTPLRGQGLLSATIPEQPNHPDQAYFTPMDQHSEGGT